MFQWKLLSQIFGSIMTLLLNGYFLGVLGSKKDFRKLEFFPVMLQSMIDFCGFGIVTLFIESLRMTTFFNWNEMQFKMNGALARAIRDAFIPTFQIWLCLSGYFKSILNTYCTGPCILAMAIDR